MDLKKKEKQLYASGFRKKCVCIGSNNFGVQYAVNFARGLMGGKRYRALLYINMLKFVHSGIFLAP